MIRSGREHTVSSRETPTVCAPLCVCLNFFPPLSLSVCVCVCVFVSVCECLPMEEAQSGSPMGGVVVGREEEEDTPSDVPLCEEQAQKQGLLEAGGHSAEANGDDGDEEDHYHHHLADKESGSSSLSALVQFIKCNVGSGLLSTPYAFRHAGTLVCVCVCVCCLAPALCILFCCLEPRYATSSLSFPSPHMHKDILVCLCTSRLTSSLWETPTRKHSPHAHCTRALCTHAEMLTNLEWSLCVFCVRCVRAVRSRCLREGFFVTACGEFCLLFDGVS